MLDRVLPDILVLIFEYLCPSDRLQLSAVSKKLHLFFWTCVPSKFRPVVGSNGGYLSVEELLKSQLFQYSALNHLQLRLEDSRRLEDWSVLAPQVISLILHCDRLSDELLFRALKPCSSLVHLTLRLSHLRWNRSPASPVLKRALSNVKHLEVILEDGGRRDWQPESVAFWPHFLNAFLSCFCRLSTLTVDGLIRDNVDDRVDTFSTLVFPVVLRHLQLHSASLRTLKIKGAAISSRQLIELASIPDLNLTHLDISKSEMIYQKDFIRFCNLQPSLRSLRIDGCCALLEGSSLRLKTMLQNKLTNLRTLSVKGISSPLIFSQLLPKLAHLQKLDIRYCENRPVEDIADGLNKSSCKLRYLFAGFEVISLLQDRHLTHLQELIVSVPKRLMHGEYEEDFDDEEEGQNNDDDDDRKPVDIFARIWEHCRCLETLGTGFFFLDGIDAPPRISNLHRLNRLDLSIQFQEQLAGSAMELLNLPDLRRLNLHVQIPRLNSAAFFRKLSRYTPRLEELELIIMETEDSDDEAQWKLMTKKYVANKYWPRLKYISFFN